MNNFDNFFEQTQTKSPQTSEFKLSKSFEMFSFVIPLKSEINWLMGLTDIKVHNSVFSL